MINKWAANNSHKFFFWYEVILQNEVTLFDGTDWYLKGISIRDKGFKIQKNAIKYRYRNRVISMTQQKRCTLYPEKGERGASGVTLTAGLLHAVLPPLSVTPTTADRLVSVTPATANWLVSGEEDVAAVGEVAVDTCTARGMAEPTGGGRRSTGLAILNRKI